MDDKKSKSYLKQQKGRKMWRVMINQILKGHDTSYIAYRLRAHTDKEIKNSHTLY